MDELVREQRRCELAAAVVDESALGGSIIARLVMLQAEARDVIAQRIEEVVALIMASAEEGSALLDELFVGGDLVRRHLERGGAVTDEVDRVCRALAGRDVDGAEVSAGDER